jgi:hypothetical protein
MWLQQYFCTSFSISSNSLRKKYILLVYKLLHNERDGLMIKRESLQEKLAIAAMAGMLVLLLAVSCVAQTPLDMSKPENCTNCSANASSSPGLDYAAQETVLSNPNLPKSSGAQV